MPTIQVNDIRMHYQVHGRGQPLVLVAGISYDVWMWHKMIPGLAEHFQVISFDNRGAGLTDKPAGPYSAQMMAADTAGLMAALGISRAHIMGHSMGGFVAQALALDYPDRVDRLVLSATNFGGPRHVPITAEAMAVLLDVSGDPIERVRRGILVSCAPGYGDAHPDRVGEWIRYRQEHPIQPAAHQSQMAVGLGLLSEQASFERRLSEVRAPTLILFGEHDQVVPPANAGLLQNAIAGAAVKILPGAGHFFPFETPEAANAAIIDFLKGG